MKKLLLILVMLLTASAAYGPGTENDFNRKIENWLQAAPLSREYIYLAFDINEIIAPVIVIAQSRLETGNYQSELCTDYNNLFGMKKARIRPTTATGSTENNYATYESWYDCIKDMKLFQQWYLSRGRDLSDYLTFLEVIGYAEDPLYIYKIEELCSKLIQQTDLSGAV